MAELPTELYDLVARLDHAAAVYNWPDCTEAARKIEALRAENTRLRDEVSDLDALRARVAALERAADNVIRCNTFGCAFPHPSFCPAQCQADQALRAALRLSGNKSEVRE